jgi:hypothetical protein
MARDATGIAGPVKLKFFHLEGGGLNHLRDYQELDIGKMVGSLVKNRHHLYRAALLYKRVGHHGLL